jgi:hypothetical protein
LSVELTFYIHHLGEIFTNNQGSNCDDTARSPVSASDCPESLRISHNLDESVDVDRALQKHQVTPISRMIFPPGTQHLAAVGLKEERSQKIIRQNNSNRTHDRNWL